MSITQQFLLDSYRAAQHGTPQPPAPGERDVRTVRELRDYRRFRAVVQERPARGRVHLALSRAFRTRRAAH
ncbi:hypothetical protein [Streptomyces sp. NPDC050504]|uniref:hypothetical protein n=1 Tax=Streptomyces sp. NPDC050504 TaxID=3365618 RepID=UPI0037954AA1